MRARGMLEVATAIVLGLGTTVGLAWGIAAMCELHDFRGQYVGTPARAPGLLADKLGVASWVREMPGKQWGYGQVGMEFEVKGVGEGNLPAGWFALWRTEFGWPMKSLGWQKLTFRPQYDEGSQGKITEVLNAFEGRGPWRHGIEFGELGPQGQERRRLPLEPIWPGLAVSFAVWSVAWWGLLFGPGRVRRWARKRRGACAMCGYDVRGLAVCPECGAAMVARKA